MHILELSLNVPFNFLYQLSAARTATVDLWPSALEYLSRRLLRRLHISANVDVRISFDLQVYVHFLQQHYVALLPRSFQLISVPSVLFFYCFSAYFWRINVFITRVTTATSDQFSALYIFSFFNQRQAQERRTDEQTDAVRMRPSIRVGLHIRLHSAAYVWITFRKAA